MLHKLLTIIKKYVFVIFLLFCYSAAKVEKEQEKNYQESRQRNQKLPKSSDNK